MWSRPFWASSNARARVSCRPADRDTGEKAKITGKAAPMLTRVRGVPLGRFRSWNRPDDETYDIVCQTYDIVCKTTMSQVLNQSYEIYDIVHNIRHRMSTDSTYDIVYDMHLRHRIRHELTDLRCRMFFLTYDIVYDMHYVTPTMMTSVRHRINSYVLCRTQHRTCDIVRTMLRTTQNI